MVVGKIRAASDVSVLLSGTFSSNYDAGWTERGDASHQVHECGAVQVIATMLSNPNGVLANNDCTF